MKLFKNRKGFTLAELLIVVAIIGVLVAIAIPVFSSQLEKSRENTDIANLRSAKAAAAAMYLDDNANAGVYCFDAEKGLLLPTIPLKGYGKGTPKQGGAASFYMSDGNEYADDFDAEDKVIVVTILDADAGDNIVLSWEDISNIDESSLGPGSSPTTPVTPDPATSSNASLELIDGIDWMNPLPADVISSTNIAISVPVDEGDTWNDLDGKTATASSPAYKTGLGYILASDLGNISSHLGTNDFVSYSLTLSSADEDAAVTIPAASFTVTFDSGELSGNTTVTVTIPAFTDSDGNEYESFSLEIPVSLSTYYAIDGVDMTDEIDPEIPISMVGA